MRGPEEENVSFFFGVCSKCCYHKEADQCYQWVGMTCVFMFFFTVFCNFIIFFSTLLVGLTSFDLFCICTYLNRVHAFLGVVA